MIRRIPVTIVVHLSELPHGGASDIGVHGQPHRLARVAVGSSAHDITGHEVADWAAVRRAILAEAKSAIESESPPETAA